MARFASQAKMGFYATPVNVIRDIKKSLNIHSGAKLLDTCCGEGEALNIVAADTEAVTYGIELDRERYEAAGKVLDNVVWGDALYEFRATRKAFSLLWLNPPYDSEESDNDQGRELAFPYPNGIKLVDNKEYKFFLTIRTDRTNQEVVLNVWLDFGDGKGWVHVVKDRKWGKNDWDPGSVPNGKDKEQIEQGPSFIKKHHIWTRANGDAFLPVKDIKIGTIDYIS